MTKLIDLTGQRFGMLVVLRRAANTAPNYTRWLCRCDCGSEKSISRQLLRNGGAKSCGCDWHAAQARAMTKHGQTGTPTYNSWSAMMTRGAHSWTRDFPRYGGRGLNVCERWHTFENFLADMGPRPKGHTLDRTDNTRGYSPDNCRWATPRQQMNNRSNTRRITHNGKTLSVSEWAEIANMPINVLANRVFDLQWPMEKALGPYLARSSGTAK